jgi:hypothetical protein
MKKEHQLWRFPSGVDRSPWNLDALSMSVSGPNDLKSGLKICFFMVISQSLGTVGNHRPLRFHLESIDRRACSEMCCTSESLSHRISAGHMLCGAGSVVGIATAYGLDGPGIEFWWGWDFPHLSRPALRPSQPPVKWVRGLSRGIRCGRGVTLTLHPLLVPRSKIEQSYTSSLNKDICGLWKGETYLHMLIVRIFICVHLSKHVLGLYLKQSTTILSPSFYNSAFNITLSFPILCRIS